MTMTKTNMNRPRPAIMIALMLGLSLISLLSPLSLTSFAQGPVQQTTANLGVQNVFTQTNTFPNIIDTGLTANGCVSVSSSTAGLLATPAICLVTSTGLFLGNGATPGTLTFQGLDNEGTITLVNNEVNRSSNTVIQIPNPLSGNGVMVVNASSPLAIDAYGNMTIGAQYQKLRCESGLGDGYNAISAETYLQTFCYNDSGVTWTITGIKCFTDNSGSSTLSATDNLANALLTGAITCSSGFAAGTQSGTTTISSGGYIKFAFAADGTSKQTTWVVSFTQ